MFSLPHLFLFLGVSLLPVYVGASGGVQLAHVLLAAYIFSSWSGAKILSSPVEKVLFALAIFVFVRESFAAILGGDASFLLNSAYLLYNLLIVGAMIRVAVNDGGVQVLRWGVLVAGLVAIIGIAIKGVNLTVDSEGGRAVGTFNNPNQLGYFSVCYVSIGAWLYLVGAYDFKRYLLSIAIALFLAVASLGKAAMLSVFLAISFSVISAGNVRRGLAFKVLILIAALFAVYYLTAAGYFDNFYFLRRLEGIGSAEDDSLESRGYFVLQQGNPLEIFIGLGGHEVDEIVGHEVHSTVFSFVGNYGLIGAGLFLAILAMWVRYVYATFGVRGALLIAVPPVFYGLTHNGSRFTIFWVLFGLSIGHALQARSKMRREGFL